MKLVVKNFKNELRVLRYVVLFKIAVNGSQVITDSW